ncbi:MAG: damage-control phosphatase ARMT1 family protein [Anaerolineae bacterium]
MASETLPPPLMVSEPGSFAEHTIVQRKPKIIADVAASNAYPPEIVQALADFTDEIARRPVAHLNEQTPDAAHWHAVWLPWQGHSWRELPWFFAETFFYRRLLACVQYFQPGPWAGRDPFAPQKRTALQQGLATLSTFYTALAAGGATDRKARFYAWLQRSLWGNRADLSNLASAAKAHRDIAGTPAEWLVIDDTAALWARFAGGQVRRLDLVADNSGLELLSDLGWADWLLAEGLVQQVRLHLKPQPFFVSDVMRHDMEDTLVALASSDRTELTTLGARLRAAQGDGRLVAHDHPFWAQCAFYSQFPPDLRAELAAADLIVFKGDVNYRRLLEDRHWPPTTELARITGFMPAPFVALRTLKGELIVGLQPGVAEALGRTDPNWLIDGERGLIHLVWPKEAQGAPS